MCAERRRPRGHAGGFPAPAWSATGSSVTARVRLALSATPRVVAGPAPSAARGIPAIYVDNDAALLAGRELGGYPKKMARITMRNYGNLFLSQMSRGSIQTKTVDPNFNDLASSSVTKGAKLFSVPLPADGTDELPYPYNLLLPLPPATGEPQDYVLPTVALKRFPGVGPGPNGHAGAEVLQLVGTPWHITQADVYAGDAAGMEIYPSEEDPIGRLLPCNAVLGAFILQGSMYTKSDEWMVLEDLKKNNAA
ncbi:acetoacetate decarboxylase family protein [Streptomyces sp. NPDC048723]|uniref:acetoacetate decarboxylase family protein n=1 Tax=Streptomyces sp. NPDC048723 TaxID=3365589 RepID=UPI003715C283